MAQAMVDFQKLLTEQEKQKETFPLQKTMSELEKELNRDIFSSDKGIKYSNTKIKARNFLTNVSYNRINKVDYKNDKFVIDCFTFLILYLNPFYLERKFETTVEREFINTLWAFLMPNNLYEYISLKENVEILNKIKVKYQDAKEIILRFVQENNCNLDVLSEFLEKNAILYQFLYGNLFPKCFSRINDYGIKAKTSFNSYFENFNIQKKVLNWNNNLQIKEEPQEYDNSSPINMVELNEDIDKTDKKEQEKEKKEKKRKISNGMKEKKREIEKQRLLQQLQENTDKLKKLKKDKLK